MARFTGFLVQALLVVLSFWLNVCHNTDVIRAGFPDVVGAVESVPDETAIEASSINVGNSANETQSLQEAGRALNKVNEEPAKTEEPYDDDRFDPKRNSASGNKKLEASSSTLVSAELAREEEMKVDESVSPKGGKLVSIPAVGVDALRGIRSEDSRILGVSPEELYRAPGQEN